MANIYISSTYQDLAAAREAVYRALRKMRHDVIAMEDYVASDQRPLDKCLTDVADCDIYVGIFAWRYGYIPPEQEHSITELEFREAVQQKKTCLLFLLHEEAPWPRKQMDADATRIEALRTELSRAYVVGFFHTLDGLAKEVSVAVAEKAKTVPSTGAVLRGSGAIAQGKGAKAVGAGGVLIEGDLKDSIVSTGDHSRVIHSDTYVESQTVQSQGAEAVDAASLREAYLRHVTGNVQKLSLLGIDPKAAAAHAHARLNLDAVYTALRTHTPESREGMPDVRKQERQDKHLSALEQLNAHKHLVLLGDPGSGKTTFVNFVALCMAGELLHNSTNLDLLTRPLPIADKEDQKPQKWDHVGLLPVRVMLKDFATKALPAGGKRATAEHLWQFIADDLSEAALAEYAPLRDYPAGRPR